MEANVKTFFERYESFFNRSLAGDMDENEVAALYAAEFIAASPAGVMTGKNDDHLKEVMAQGYARYRAMGTKAIRMSIPDRRLSLRRPCRLDGNVCTPEPAGRFDRL